MWNDTDIPLALLITFRAYGTWLHGDSRMREVGAWPFDHSPWAEKGSKRRLWNERHIEAAIDYVLYGQGEDLPRFE